MQDFLITREIGIDMGHRVTYHGSKCRNLHGHRYTIQATCKGSLFTSGEQEGMVLDFGFLKDEMMTIIDVPFDHGTTLWIEDPLLAQFLAMDPEKVQLDYIRSHVNNLGFWYGYTPIGKTAVISTVPTAENLAEHWFTMLKPRVAFQTKNQAELLKIKVWETPNCSAEYPA